MDISTSCPLSENARKNRKTVRQWAMCFIMKRVDFDTMYKIISQTIGGITNTVTALHARN